MLKRVVFILSAWTMEHTPAHESCKDCRMDVLGFWKTWVSWKW